MMKQLFLIIFLLSITKVFAQAVTYEEVKREFEFFDHEKVITLSNELLKDTTLSNIIKVDVYLMRARTFYALGNESNSKISFGEILKINKDYMPDPSVVSPKLISLFDEVKSDYIKSLGPDSTSTNQIPKVFDSDLMKGSVARNIILPGWGQLHSGNTPKGIVLSAFSASMLASMIYFISDASQKEKDYLNETDKTLIQEKYNTYNTSYKIRNALIISYAAIWIFSQLDLIFLSEEEIFMKEAPTSSGDVNLGVRIPF